MKVVVWFWIIDETYVLTFVMSCDMSKVVMITLNDVMATCDDDQVLNLKKKKEKNKTI